MPQATVGDTPVSAIVIFRNEKRVLGGCLAALRGWVDELICIDMASSDGSRIIAEQYADRVLEVDPYPIAEPTRVAAARQARNNWVLLIDPDEHIPAELVPQIQQTLREKPDACSVCLPWWYYFKGARLDGTIWGADPTRPERRPHKRMLIHRDRCALLPYCNRITEPKPGYEDAKIPHDGENHIAHYWSFSYRDLLKRHITRYCHTEAAAQYATGTRFKLGRALKNPLSEAHRCLRHYDGWRLGPRGFALTAIYILYIIASDWLVLFYQLQNRPAEKLDTTQIPTLREAWVRETPRRAAAA